MSIAHQSEFMDKSETEADRQTQAKLQLYPYCVSLDKTFSF